jgi:hypothetical protein
MSTEVRIASFESGEGLTVKIGYTNRNEQRCCGTLGVPGTDGNAYAYKLECTLCGFVYGANSGDVHERKCPNCQDGKPGIRFWLIARKVPVGAAGANGGLQETRVERVAVETAADWLDRHAGSFKDDPVFEEIVKLGREFREADRPPDDGR